MCALQFLCGLKSQAKVLAYTSAGLPSGLNPLLSSTKCKETLTPVPAAQTYKACLDVKSTDSIAVIQIYKSIGACHASRACITGTLSLS